MMPSLVPTLMLIACTTSATALVAPAIGMPARPAVIGVGKLAVRVRPAMGVRTDQQKAAFPAAFNDKEPPLGFVKKYVPAAKTAAKAGVAGLAVGSVGAVALRLGWMPAISSTFRLVATRAVVLARTAILAAVAVVTGSTASMLLGRLLTRVIDWGVPTLAVGFLLSGLKGPPEPDDGASGSSPLGGLFKRGGGGGVERGVTLPKELIKVEPLGERLASFEFSLESATGSRSAALAAERRRALRRRFNDDLGGLSDTALAALAEAEAAWRKEAAAPAAAAVAARGQVRELSVQLGGAVTPPGERAASEAPGQGALRKRLAKAHARLARAQRASADAEVSFLQAASEALGSGDAGAWEARAKLSALAARPASWEPLAPPLEHGGVGGDAAGAAGAAAGGAAGGAAGSAAAAARAFVLDFPGDVQASSVATLREEVTAVVGSADAARGDRVVLRLSSGGGTVTGYGLAAAQLLRLKEADLHLTICVEQVAASGGYMMACVADRIVASPFAVLGSIGVITEQPNVYERLRKEGVEFSTVTAGKYKRRLSPTKKLDDKDVVKTKEEIEEVFGLFKAFVARHRPQLDIEAVATGETWFGEDALRRNLTDALQTFDGALLELHRGGVDIFSVSYQQPSEGGALARLAGAGGGGGADGLLPHLMTRRAGWGARLLGALLGAGPVGMGMAGGAPALHAQDGLDARMYARYDPSLQ